VLPEPEEVEPEEVEVVEVPVEEEELLLATDAVNG
jgi:hypothetical protein